MSADDELQDDPCRGPDGAFAFVLLFVVFFGCGGIAMFSETHIVRLLAAAVAYTACVMIYGFARNKNGIPRYFFTCPVVVSQYPRLLRRHAVFLSVQTGFMAVGLRYFLHPPTGASRAEDENGMLVAFPLAVLALIEIFTNRGILDRAHNDRFGEPPASDEAERGRPVSFFGRDQ